ncbi:unnamed protein product [Cylicostephanus goldi]|uniref:Uncharacterized protein n=1 Tax=Cylicostephanus goldi TaxID=71465 RepID=A0A3P6SCN5_CYLGO|nr:unnamed protein product [Cylicostephanus goldi]
MISLNTVLFSILTLQISYETGPLCWPHEEPRVEDNYRNVAPVFGQSSEVSSDTYIPGDVPMEVFFNLRSLTNFEISDVTDYKFEQLLTPPLGFSYKFIGAGQVSLPFNQTWSSH